MFRQSAERQRRTPRLILIGGLLTLIGFAAGATAVPGAGPAHPPAPAVPLTNRLAGTDGQPPSDDPVDFSAADASSEAPEQEALPADGPMAVPAPAGAQVRSDRSADFSRSLVYSGLLGLLICSIGLTLVGRRRRLW